MTWASRRPDMLGVDQGDGWVVGVRAVALVGSVGTVVVRVAQPGEVHTPLVAAPKLGRAARRAWG